MLMRCTSGRHEWTDEVDALKCCNGFHRELRIGREALEAVSGGPLINLPECLSVARYLWVRDSAQEVGR